MSAAESAMVSSAVLAAYGFSDNAEVRRFGNGHINGTYFVEERGHRLILQQINCNIFPEPAALIKNALAIEQHLLQKQQQGAYPLQVLRQQPSLSGQFLVGEGQDWRALQFIEGGRSIEVVENAEQAYAAAFTFGQFAKALSDFSAVELVTVIPNFHNLSMRFVQLEQAIKQDAVGRLSVCQALVDECLANKGLADELAHCIADLPLRVCHNDTKINNMLYSEPLGKGIAAIDLDTCMPGYWLFDFGDMVRTCCSPEPEDSLKPEHVQIRPEIFAALAQGYLQGLADCITALEKQSLLLGAKVMCLMIGVRFLTDFLNGDRYFAVHRPNHNLQRAENQLRLYRDLVRQQDTLQALLK